VMFNGARQKTPVVVYVPFGRALPRLSRLMFYVRTTDDPSRIAPDVRALIRRVLPRVPMRGPLLTVENLVELQMFQERAIAQVASFFSGCALLLACIGLYGVLAYNVAQRTREIGIRMALGAARHDVLWLVIRDGVGLAAAGCIVGLIAAVALVRLLARLLYGVTATDPLTLGATAAALLAVALLASWLPARRAAKVDPMIALRAE
jgi:ABC-type antimicrobial peptide transport system permease subunit